MMRVALVGLLFAACSQPAKHAEPVNPTQPSDGGVSLLDADVDAAIDATVAAAHRDAADEGHFDWDKVRKRIDEARAARRGQPPKPRPNCSDAPCEAPTMSIAAWGHRVGEWSPDQPLATFALDVGTDDGVGPHYWGAVLGKDGRPITRFQHVTDVDTRKCLLRLEVSDYPRGGLDKIILIVDPSEDQKVGP